MQTLVEPSVAVGDTDRSLESVVCLLQQPVCKQCVVVMTVDVLPG